MTGVSGGIVPGELVGMLEILAPAAAKSLLLLLAGWLVTRLVGRRSAAVKHLVWMATLAGCLLLPLAEAGLPEAFRLDTGPVAATLAEGLRSATDILGGAGPVASADGASGPGTAAAAASESAAPEAAVGATGPVAAELRALGAGVVALWLAGTLAVLLRTTWGLLRLARIRRRSCTLDDAVVETAGQPIRRLASEAGLEVRVSPEISLPVVQGILRPTLLLPQEALDEWPADRTRAVLLHEAGHVERRDFTSHLVARLACALYWFNPGVWWAAREVRKEQERACDDVVLRAGHRPSSYARHLLSIAREGAGSGALAGVSMAHWSDLEGRVLALLREDMDRSPARRGWLAGVAAPAVVVVLALGALSFNRAGAVPPADGTPHVGSTAWAERGGTAAGEASPGPALRGPESAREGDAVAGLVSALDHPSARVRKEAAHRLAELESPAAVPALEKAMLGDPSRRVRRAAAWAIGESESEAAVDALARGLEAADGELRHTIVAALGETERPGAVPLLSDALERGDRKTRWKALKALTENETDAARTAFRRALSGRDPVLRAMARRVLEKRRDHGKTKKEGERTRDENRRKG